MKMRYFSLAKCLSPNSDHHQHKLSCIYVKKNRIISYGWNKLKTHSRSPHAYKSTHAEFDATIGIPSEKLKGCEAYIYRETKLGEIACARPCKDCLNMLQSLGIKKIYYTDYGSYKEEII